MDHETSDRTRPDNVASGHQLIQDHEEVLRDNQTAHATRSAPVKVIAAGMIGTTLEFYDFIVYGTVAALVFNQQFFPAAAPGIGTLLALSTFAVGFLARPVGAALFGHLGDRIGRKHTLMLTLLMMGGATVLIGVLPGYATIGFWAPLALVALRLLQGAAVGGEWGGAVLLISEHVAEHRRGWATSFAQLGSPLGLLLSNGVVLGTVAIVGTAGFQSWGWRIPFLLSVVLIVVGVVLRRTVEESPVFRRMQAQQATAKSPVTEVLRHHRGRLLLAIGVTVVSFGGYYVFTTVGLAYVSLREIPTSYGLYGTVIGAALSLPVIIGSGTLSDRIGRRPLYAVAAVVMAVWAFAFFPLIETRDPLWVSAAFAVGIVGWSVLYGAQGAFLSELFPSRVRYTGASLAYQVTGALGGLVPLASLSLLETLGTTTSIATFVALTAVVSLVAIRDLPIVRRGHFVRLVQPPGELGSTMTVTAAGSASIEHHHADLGDVRLHYVTAGHGEPVVLLHGWPQTWFCWRRVLPLLAGEFTVVAPDLRGLGDSSRPAGGYDTHTVAADLDRLLRDELRIDRFHVIGHDWGGIVGYALAANFPGPVASLTVVDVAIPGDGNPNISQGGRRWHHAFHQTEGLPEAMVTGREEQYLGWFYDNYGHRKDVITPEERAEYLRTYSQPEALRAGFEYYRALEQDARDNERLARDRRISIPVLAIGGASGWGRGTEVAESLSRLVDDVTGAVVDEAGHWVPEEQPAELVRLFRTVCQRAAAPRGSAS